MSILIRYLILIAVSVGEGVACALVARMTERICAGEQPAQAFRNSVRDLGIALRDVGRAMWDNRPRLYVSVRFRQEESNIEVSDMEPDKEAIMQEAVRIMEGCDISAEDKAAVEDMVRHLFA